MYRLIIADDEPWVAYRLTRLVDYAAFGFEVTSTAADGTSALQLCQTQRADALLTDIRMPGMDGIELLHALKEAGLDTQVVLVSGYAEFGYAQAALREGAFDYLIKQVSAVQLEDVLRRLKAHLDQHRDAQRVQRESQALLALFQDETLSLGEWLVQCGLRAEQACFGCFAQEPPQALLTFRTGREMFTSVFACPDGRMPDISLTPGGFSAAADIHQPASELLRQCQVAFLTAKFLDLPVPYPYRSASTEEAQRLLQELDAALAGKNQPLCQMLLTRLAQQAASLNLSQLAQVYNRLCALFARYRNPDAYVDEAWDYRQLTQAFSGLQEMFAYFQEDFSAAPAPDDACFDSVLQYIDASFMRDLRIADLAERFHFSPCYFSTLFHKRVGVTFTKYLTQRRMRLAKELLADRGLSLQEVAEQSGFSDYFQFSKTFKRHEGMAPGQYRRQLPSSADAQSQP